jgi:DNA-binding NarL/FixJ family response regulator
MNVSVLIVEDHEAIRKAVGLLLRSEGLDVVGTTGRASEALELIRRRGPHVALVDVNLGAESGIGLVRKIADGGFATQVVLYTGAEDDETLRAAMAAGAMGVVAKASAPSVLLEGIRAVVEGEPYVDPRLYTLLAPKPEDEPLLTPREREVMQLVAAGLDGEEIAARLFVSPLTVRTHIRNAMERLTARTRPQAVAIALKRREIG